MRRARRASSPMAAGSVAAPPGDRAAGTAGSSSRADRSKLRRWVAATARHGRIAVSLGVAALAVPGTAEAAVPPGGLVQLTPPNACYANTAAGGCIPFGASASGFGLRGLAVSPGGAHVYVTGSNGGSGVAFGRDAATGALAGLGAAGGGGSVAVAVAPDGLDVYFGVRDTGANAGGVGAFRRNVATGLLSFSSCIDDPGPPSSSCPNGAGLYDVEGIAVSPDARTVYAAAHFGGGDDPGDPDSVGEGAVTAFSRNPTTGAMAQIQCRPTIASASGLCDDTAVNAIEGAEGLVVSPDGRFVYVASRFDSAVVGFNRAVSGPDTGKLASPVNCIASSASSGDPACAAAPGMLGAAGLAIAPDGADVYVAAFNRGVVALRRNVVSGVLSWNQCLGGAGCDPDPAVMASARNVTVSPDGLTVYVVGGNAGDGYVRAYRRDPTTGRLTPLNCIGHLGTGGCTTGAGLLNADNVVVSPDGRHLYTASFQGGDGNGAVSAFAVVPAPRPAPSPAPRPPAPPAPTDARPTSRIGKRQLTIAAARLRRFKGTASDDRGVRTVHIALIRLVGGAKPAALRKRCHSLSSRGTLVTSRIRRGRCVIRGFLRARGTTSWSFRLKRRLPRGTYTLYSRATDSAGQRETVFSARRRNRVTFKVR